MSSSETCSRCGGPALQYTEGDAHKSAGWIPCQCWRRGPRGPQEQRKRTVEEKSAALLFGRTNYAVQLAAAEERMWRIEEDMRRCQRLFSWAAKVTVVR